MQKNGKSLCDNVQREHRLDEEQSLYEGWAILLSDTLNLAALTLEVSL